VNIANSVAIVCGPPVMMKYGTFKLLEMGYPNRTFTFPWRRICHAGLENAAIV